MAYVMFTIILKENAPSIELIATILGVPISALDQQFGVVLIDPIISKYTILLDEVYANTIKDARIQGPFSNPKISHYSIQVISGCNCFCHSGEFISHVKPCCRVCDHCGLRVKTEDTQTHPCPGTIWHLERGAEMAT